MASIQRDPELKRTANFWSWAAFFGLMILMGSMWAWTGKIPQHRRDAPALDGPAVPWIGLALAGAGAFGMYRLCFRAKQSELSIPGFHTLGDFDDCICGYRVTFRIEHDQLSTGNRGQGTPVFNYVLRVHFKTPPGLEFRIRRRDRFEVFLWYVGVERWGDVLTGHRYFDSRYRAEAQNRNVLLSWFNNEIIPAIEKFDRDYPPIRLKNGWLHINRTTITYTEGPYADEQRIFDPHRGRIDQTAAELIRLAQLIESAAPSS